APRGGGPPRPPRSAADERDAPPPTARYAAATSLIEAEDGAHLEDALDANAPPAGPDRDLAWFLAFGVLRRRGHVDAALRSLVSQPITALDPPVRAVLRLGAFEVLFARTPRHAIVHQAVETVRALGAGRAHGMVNAVLRRVEPIESLSEADALDTPAWLLARWNQRYGVEATAAWCRANAENPPLFAVAKPGWAAPSDWTPVGRDVYRVEATGQVSALPGFAEGAWWVQDLASVQVADLVADAAAPGSTVLDACAAPGGKTFRLAARGLAVFATDVDPRRLDRVREGAARLGLVTHGQVVDWTDGGADLGAYDAVLVDAPCTGLGTVRRHPEIRWKRTEPDLYRASALEHRIADRALAHVRPGGFAVYAVCSPEPEEGEEVVERLLADRPGWTVEARLSTAPPVAGEDAHFAVRIRRPA
ncbi:MAG: transcription antitermination factor NusB, partial [Myxococcota bacterium]